MALTVNMASVNPAACRAGYRSSSLVSRSGAGTYLHRSAALRVSSMCPALAPFRVGRKKTHFISQTRAPCTTVTPLRVVCANPRRVQKVQQQMRREISNMLQTDKVRAVRCYTRDTRHTKTLGFLVCSPFRFPKQPSSHPRAEHSEHDIPGRAHGCGQRDFRDGHRVRRGGV